MTWDSAMNQYREDAQPIEAPRTEPEEEQDDWEGVYPGYCVDPETCRGKTHCPRDYSCVE